MCIRAAAATMRGSMPSSGRSEGEALGAGEILLTSMDTDGVQRGFDCELTRARCRTLRIFR